MKFQTLPGIILHFYPSNRSACKPGCVGLFQTLPGIILHFYR